MPAQHFYRQRFVLLVEQNTTIQRVFRRVFARHPEFLLDVANTVEKAKSKVHTFGYDVIFLGMEFFTRRRKGRQRRLYRYAGMKVLRELSRLVIKVKSEFRGVMATEVIIMSGPHVELRKLRPEAHALGVISFIDKPVPFTEDYLTHIVQRMGFPILPPHTL
jgi:hypothetical protein